MIDTEIKKIRKWAENGDRIDPTDPSLTPVLSRELGWPASFSTTDTPRREVFNQLMREVTGGLYDLIHEGILEWDREIDYRVNAITKRNATLHRATVATGPASGNATDPATPGQAVWVAVGGGIEVPAAPNAPTATAPRPGELVWVWNCPLDGGREVTSFDFQWREQGSLNWSQTISTPHARHELSGLTNGNTVEARVKAVTSFGRSADWSPVGRATPRAQVPDGGNALALRLTPGNGRVEAAWLMPDANGDAIDNYTLQWRTQNQGYSASRQRVVTALSTTITGLSNGTQIFARVFATNGVGAGPPSNEASATPVAPPPAPPADTAPAAPPTPTYVSRRPYVLDVRVALPPSNGGQRISGFDLQWRYQGSSWGGNVLSGTTGCFTITAADASRAVQCRARANNSVGASAWSTVLTVPTAALLAPLPQKVTISADQTYRWPYATASRAVAVVQGMRVPVSVTVGPVTPTLIGSPSVIWDFSAGSRPDLSSLSRDGAVSIFLFRLQLPRSSGNPVLITLSPNQLNSPSPFLGGPEFSGRMVDYGTLEAVASDGSTVTISLTSLNDPSEPYQGTPSNAAAIRSFVSGVARLSNKNVTFIFRDGPNASPTTLQVGGQTYTTRGNASGLAVAELSGLSVDDQLAIDVGTGGRVDIYPQA